MDTETRVPGHTSEFAPSLAELVIGISALLLNKLAQNLGGFAIGSWTPFTPTRLSLHHGTGSQLRTEKRQEPTHIRPLSVFAILQATSFDDCVAGSYR
jgi:hypothetical protein